MSSATVNPCHPDKVNRYKPPSGNGQKENEDLMSDYMDILGMAFSMCGVMMGSSSHISPHSFHLPYNRVLDDLKQILSSLMLNVSAVVMSSLQNPTLLTPSCADLLRFPTHQNSKGKH
uniref:Uncharacterized protein n=1 Tax=Phlebotomus papatasi TaxID=29031 RepID=A0A1B0DPW4_PHLPP